MNCTIEVKIKTHNYEDKEGVKKYATKIIANSLIMLNKPNSGVTDKAEIDAGVNQ